MRTHRLDAYCIYTMHYSFDYSMKICIGFILTKLVCIQCRNLTIHLLRCALVYRYMWRVIAEESTWWPTMMCVVLFKCYKKMLNCDFRFLHRSIICIVVNDISFLRAHSVKPLFICKIKPVNNCVKGPEMLREPGDRYISFIYLFTVLE